MDLNYCYASVCLAFNSVTHFREVLIPCQHWLGLHDRYSCLSPYVESRLRTILFVPQYLGGISLVYMI
jgi:hypothetical protein